MIAPALSFAAVFALTVTFSWGTFSVGLLVAVVIAISVLLSRFKTRIRREGIPAAATIVRMHSSGGSNAGAPIILLSLEWALEDGTPHSQDIEKACDLGNLPQQGDRFPISYWPKNPTNFEFESDTPLRHDDAMN